MNLRYKDWEERIDAFERSWATTPPADLGEFAEAVGPVLRQELTLIDLERRYRSPRGSLPDALGNTPQLEDYVHFFASRDQSIDVTFEMVAEEYRIRTIWDDLPGLSHYQERFPQFAPHLSAKLQRIDKEIQVELPAKQNLRTHFDARAPLQYDDFKIQCLIGAGGVGKVYRCEQKSLQRSVALKALRKQFLDNDWVVESFLQEATILARLNHQNVVRLLGVGQFPAGGIFQVMEFVDGPNLRQWMRGETTARDECTQMNGTEILQQVATAVDYAHQQNVVHCDLKPQNILLAANRVAVADFGMARLLRQNSQTAVRPLGGSERYSAPEIRYGSTVSAVADVFSIGAIGDELIASGHMEASDDLKNCLRECQATQPSDRPNLLEVIEHLGPPHPRIG